ncbi:uncharacterized protein BKA78DRAFT_61037 [Phyllosticta capitalensis]|uniref:uncharacterized protein n=1 Tax=Phyllosticta capitalensis TaxID=121624 RepID=UPI0031305CBD
MILFSQPPAAYIYSPSRPIPPFQNEKNNAPANLVSSHHHPIASLLRRAVPSHPVHPYPYQSRVSSLYRACAFHKQEKDACACIKCSYPANAGAKEGK